MEINWQDMLWTIINFLILVAILNIFLYKPIVRVLENRKNEIANNLNQAEQAKLDAEKTKEQYATQLKNAKREAQEIITRANKLGEDGKNEIIAEARNEAEKITIKAKEEIEREKKKALSEIRDEVATLAVMTAEKIINKNINDKDQERLVQDFIKEVGESH